MTDPKDITIRELSSQITELQRELERLEYIEEVARDADEERYTALIENEKLRGIVPEFEARALLWIGTDNNTDAARGMRHAVTMLNKVQSELLGVETEAK